MSKPTEPLTEEYLDELRATYAGTESAEGRIIVALLDELETVDDALHASEDEVESLRAKVARLRQKISPKAPSASLSKTPSGKWAVRWRVSDGLRHSQSFPNRRDAEHFRADLLGRWNGGAR
ncbi:hypothetical protein ACFVVU_23500 [Kitasatospora sp. NPDC057965]|uniref:hypothetical protein n=1 Tax=Kitasatospora sp. NPDC057965 TaxID=3346291 RepID=UPI0036D836C1